jgi:4-amino-4-deoxy-L-arabinose transferase-like glycosyltransferase
VALAASFRVSEEPQLNSPNPALVSQREAAPLPRAALLVLCAAYVLPGLVGRDPWKSADITSFGYSVGIASGRTGWLAPTVGGLPADGALLPYWIGAAFVRVLSPLVDPIVAARIPFALLLALALSFT